MRIFLLKLIGFLALLAALFLFASAADRWIVRPENLFKLQRAFFDAQEETSVVFLGDSHAAMAIDGAALPEGWVNFAYPADSAADMLGKAVYAADRRTVRAFVVPTDEQLFSSFRGRQRNLCGTLSLLNTKQVKATYGMRADRKLRANLLCALPLVNKIEREKFMIAIAGLLKDVIRGSHDDGTDVTFDASGSWRRKKLFRGMDGNDGKEVFAKQIGTSAQPQDNLVETYRALIRFARERGITVIGVRYPVDNRYQDAMAATDLSAFAAAIDSLPFDARFDYTGIFAGKQEYFDNSDHLNSEGSTAITRRIVQDIRRVL